MSYGERSCRYYANNCPLNGTDPSVYNYCNVDCEYYEWDLSTPPDSEPDIAAEIAAFQKNMQERRVQMEKEMDEIEYSPDRPAKPPPKDKRKFEMIEGKLGTRQFRNKTIKRRKKNKAAKASRKKNRK